jgi:hypothetical protein
VLPSAHPAALEDCPGGAAGEASPAVSKRLHELLAEVAMQFGGYIFRLSESQAAYLLSFASAVDAVRFCHSAQALLMYTPWESAAAGGDCADFCGRTGGGTRLGDMCGRLCAAVAQWCIGVVM